MATAVAGTIWAMYAFFLDALEGRYSRTGPGWDFFSLLASRSWSAERSKRDDASFAGVGAGPALKASPTDSDEHGPPNAFQRQRSTSR